MGIVKDVTDSDGFKRVLKEHYAVVAFSIDAKSKNATSVKEAFGVAVREASLRQELKEMIGELTPRPPASKKKKKESKETHVQLLLRWRRARIAFVVVSGGTKMFSRYPPLSNGALTAWIDGNSTRHVEKLVGSTQKELQANVATAVVKMADAVVT